MHQVRSGWTRLQYYSNPNVSTDGQATGTVNNNVALQIQNAAPVVAGFRPFIGALTAGIDAFPDTDNAGQEFYSCEAVATCGSAPYTYEWRLSTNGITFGPIVGTGEFYSLPPSSFIYCGDVIFLQLRINSSDGQTSTNVRTLTNPDPGCGDPFRTTLEAGAEQIQAFLVYPNPVEDILSIEIPSTEKLISVEVFDGQGRSYFVRNSDLLPGQLQIDAKAWPPGFYVCRIQSEDKAEIHKLIVH